MKKAMAIRRANERRHGIWAFFEAKKDVSTEKYANKACGFEQQKIPNKVEISTECTEHNPQLMS